MSSEPPGIEQHIEQRRRDFKRLEPELYAYITNTEAARVLEIAGDLAGGYGSEGYQHANRLWRVAGGHRQQAARARGERS